MTAAQRDHPRGCGPLHSPVPPDGGGARGEPSRAPPGSGQGLGPQLPPSTLGDVTSAQPPVLTLRVESPTLNQQSRPSGET